MPDVFKNTRFVFILITAFLSVMGIGLIIPVIPFIVSEFVDSTKPDQIALYVGLLISLYSFCQFFAAPVLGALSDKYGRRPILLLCLTGSAIGYILFGIGGSLIVLFIGRVIDGLTGGDISTIFAYIADITAPANRGKYFGVIGATVGLGFILGPSLGGFLSHISLSAPLFFAAGLTLLNALFGFFVLPESLDKKHRMTDFSLHHLNPFVQLTEVLKDTHIKHLFTMAFFYFFAFSMLQGVGSVFLKDTVHFSPSDIGLYFLVLGLGDMFTQGFLSGKLMPRFGTVKLALAGFILTGVAYTINTVIPLFPHVFLVYGYILVYAFGSGMFEPASGAMISAAAGPTQQGRVQGASQSMQSIARIIGPITASFMYQFGAGVPYSICVILSLFGAFYLFTHREEMEIGHAEATDS